MKNPDSTGAEPDRSHDHPEKSAFDIRVDLDALLSSGEPVILELGCGEKRVPGRIGVDRLDLPTVDIIADLNHGLPFLPDGSVDAIYSNHVLEHLSEFETVVGEIARVLKPGATKHLRVPHFSNPYFYSDYTHSRAFGLYTFDYFVPEAYQMRRKVPTFYSEVRIRIVSRRLIFRSQFRPLHYLKKAFERFVNSHSLLQEIYEENFVYWIPCYELEVVFTPDRSASPRPPASE